MSDSATTSTSLSNIAIAPRHPLGQKGHIRAYRAQAKFLASDTLGAMAPTNPWRGGSPGSVFFDSVLASKPATVGAALELAKGKGISEVEAQAHLRWLYTWSKIEVNGKVYGAPIDAPSAPVTSSVAPTAPAKVKAPAKKASK
jgi:hypothetical protein